MATLPETLDRVRDGAVPRDLESELLEFKQEESADPRRSLGMLADAVVCLANAEGGTIVVGVADAIPGRAAFRGVSTGLTVDVIRKGIFDRPRSALLAFTRRAPLAEFLDRHSTRVLAGSNGAPPSMSARTWSSVRSRVGCARCSAPSPGQT